MVDLDDLIVCSMCQARLPLDEMKIKGTGCCPQCESCYTVNGGIYNMTPLPTDGEMLKSKWDTWQKLQENNLVCFNKAPEFNLSIGSREDAQAFKNFCQPSGLILDVGCGPQEYPSYLPEHGEVVGIDPFLGQQPRGFGFVQGMGEYLPFRSETFDHILYGSSLDHIIEPKRSLAEAVRCLKPNGRINMWIDGLATDDSSTEASRSGHYQILIRKGFKALSRHGWFAKMGLRRTLSYIVTVARMEVPEGASDCFHFVHLDMATVFDWLRECKLTVIRHQEYPVADSVFVQAHKQP